MRKMVAFDLRARFLIFQQGWSFSGICPCTRHIGSSCSYAPTPAMQGLHPPLLLLILPRYRYFCTSVGILAHMHQLCIPPCYSWYFRGTGKSVPQYLSGYIGFSCSHAPTLASLFYWYLCTYVLLVLLLLLLRCWEVEVLLYLSEHIGPSFSDMHQPLHSCSSSVPLHSCHSVLLYHTVLL